MVSFKRKPKAAADLQLSSTSITQPLLSNEDICGCAVYTLPPGVEFSHSKVTLKGVVTTRTDENPDALQRTWRTERSQFLGASLDSTARTALAESKADGGSITIPFRFNLEDIFAQTQSTTMTSLPPSLNSKDESGGKWSGLRSTALAGQYDVAYSISASVYSKKGLEASTSKDIFVLPVSQNSLESPSDTPGEYFFAASSSPSTKVSLAKAPSFALEVAGQEPEAVIIDANDTALKGSTTIPFVVKAVSRSNKHFDINELPKHCQIRAQLVSKTLLTPDRIEERFIPYINQSIFANTSSQKVQKSDEQEHSLTLPQWNHVSPGLDDQFALTNFSFDFKIAGDKILPSFFTPLLSRRYAIDFTIGFSGSSSPSLKLSLPVNIVYESDDFDYVKP